MNDYDSVEFNGKSYTLTEGARDEREGGPDTVDGYEIRYIAAAIDDDDDNDDDKEYRVTWRATKEWEQAWELEKLERLYNDHHGNLTKTEKRRMRYLRSKDLGVDLDDESEACDWDYPESVEEW